MLLNWHPLIGEHDPGPAVHLDDVVVVIHQPLRLLASTDRNSLVRMDLIERPAHMGMLPYGRVHPAETASCIREQISSGVPFPSSLSRDRAPWSHLLTHTPQPMQLLVDARWLVPSSTSRAWNWQ